MQSPGTAININERTLYHAVAVSIISHLHGAMVERLVQSLLSFPEVGQIIVTINASESLYFQRTSRIIHRVNDRPRGFAENHNRAFSDCSCPYFCVLNPDIEMPFNPFPVLLEALHRTGAAIVAPLVTNALGAREDSIRTFPTLRSLVLKTLGMNDGRHHISDPANYFFPEWVAGMFMVFDRSSFLQLKGFDARFFLYYEDVDICARAWKSGLKVLTCPQVAAIHHAQRASRRNLQHLYWHISSMARYFCKHWGRLPAIQPGD